MTPVALSIAGSDPSGGAGLQADLKTFHQFGVYGEAVVTLITVQNSQGVKRVEVLDPTLVLEQLHAVLADIPPHAAKTGALGNVAMTQAVAQAAKSFSFPLVVDPVMISKHGAALLEDEARAAIAQHLLPVAYLFTPNLHEASILTGTEVRTIHHMEQAGAAIREMGAKNVLVKGGHLEGDALDVLITEDGKKHFFNAPRIDSVHTHGTGCTLSAAITAGLAKGLPLLRAVADAKAFISNAIRTSPQLGGGTGPLNHHADPH